MGIIADAQTSERARSLKVELASHLFGAIAASAGQSYLAAIPPGNNIRGFGYGTKSTGHSVVVDECVRVYVRTKLPKRDVPQEHQVPAEINGYPTDVIAVGEVSAAFPRPVPGGVSCGHPNVTAGTLGCLVDRNGAGRFILSNNHVIADSNAASIGDPILEPGRIDGGSVNPPIARLTDFVKIDFTGAANRLDAAVAELINPGDVTPEIKNIGRVTPATIPPALHMSVRKQGRTSGHTVGIIDDLSADIPVTYPGHGMVPFEDQLAISGVAGLFGQGGDSGSLVVDAVSLRPVGLLFAVSGSVTYCNKIDLVLTTMNLSIL